MMMVGGTMRTKPKRGSYTSQTTYRPAAKPRSTAERLKANRGRIALGFIIVAGLAFAAGWNPPTNTVHYFSEASNYNARRESGCTNSGEGCHGSDAKLKDFNVYHPETPCKTCHEYTGVGCIPCHAPSQRECTGCHDGSMQGASDCVRLTDPYPSGHYRDSLHTAMGTDMTTVMRTAEGGEAQATCGDCHSRDLKSAHTSVRTVEDSDERASLGCAECHNDVKSGALEQVKTDWKLHQCIDCHSDKTDAPMHADDFAPTSVEGSGEAGCGDTGAGCHAGNKLHALHPNAPKTCSGSAVDGEPGCHDLTVQAPKPTQSACGTGEDTCHATYLNTELSHKNDSEAHSAEGGRQGSATLTDRVSGVTLTCAVCHSMDLTAEHTRPGSPLGGDSCLGCHNANDTTSGVVKASWAERDTADACAACHGDGMHGAIDTVHTATQIADNGRASESGCVASGCHSTADVRSLHAAQGCTLAGCHNKTGAISGSAALSCGGPAGTGGACHTGADKHRNFAAKHTGIELDFLSGRAVAGSCARTGCHPTVALDVLHDDKGCAIAGCHTAGGPGVVSCGGPAGTGGACHTAADTHRTLTFRHGGTELDFVTGLPTPGSCVRAGCHATAAVDELHGTGGCTIAGCHGESATSSCGGPAGTPGACHTAADAHTTFAASHTGIELDQTTGDPTPGSCVRVGCHPTVAVDQLHGPKGCNISGCHAEDGTSGVVSCGGPAGTEGACHTTADTHGDLAAKHTGVELDPLTGDPTEGSCARPGCHATVAVDQLHGPEGCNVSGCHAEDGTTSGVVSCGGPIGTEGACHVAGQTHQGLFTKHFGIELDFISGAPVPGSCQRAGCHPTIVLYELHSEAGCALVGCHGPAGTKSCGGPAGTPGACHTTADTHTAFAAKHAGIELDITTGEPTPGTCLGAGCHATASLYSLHTTTSCATVGCHGASSTARCGGPEGTAGACHAPPPVPPCTIAAIEAGAITFKPMHAPLSREQTVTATPSVTATVPGPEAAEDQADAIGAAPGAEPTESDEPEPSGPPADAPDTSKDQPADKLPVSTGTNVACLECHTVGYEDGKAPSHEPIDPTSKPDKKQGGE